MARTDNDDNLVEFEVRVTDTVDHEGDLHMVCQNLAVNVARLKFASGNVERFKAASRVVVCARVLCHLHGQMGDEVDLPWEMNAFTDALDG